MAFGEELKASEAFRELPRGVRNLVFYSEGHENWPHFRGIIHELLQTHRYPVVYLTSSKDDPGLRLDSPLIKSFQIGAGGPRTDLFRTLDADIMVMTMPDLESLSLNKSHQCGHYAYIFHSPVSSHMIYRADAFDHYDSIFCVGPHHEAEIRKRESLLGLSEKHLIAHGYGRLDEITAHAKDVAAIDGGGPPHVLVAPSWGPNCIFETVGGELIEVLLSAGFRVTARPHPQTLRVSRDKIDAWLGGVEDHENFEFETEMSAKQSFYQADVMISDWSGAALDFAFGCLKPVVFIDTPKKINNDQYESLGIEPLEVSIRHKIGKLVDPDDLSTVPAIIESIMKDRESFTHDIQAARDRWIYNPGSGDRVAADALVRMAAERASVPHQDGETIDALAVETAETLLMNCPPSTGQPGELTGFIRSVPALSGAGSAEQIAGMDSLCRRIDVFKKLHKSYEPGFAKIAGGELLEMDAYPALIFRLITTARTLARSDRGKALKFLNSAGNALNIYMSGNGISGTPLYEALIFRAYDEMGVLK